MSKEIRRQLKALRDAEGHINPRDAWVSDTRSTLLRRIGAQTTALENTTSKFSKKTTHFQALFPTQFFFRMKPVMVSVLVFALATSGWIASASASESLPGDKMWHVKLASEKTQIVLADISGNEQKNVQLQLKFAARRAEEIKTVSKEEKFLPEEKIKRAEEGLKKLKENISSVDVVVQQAAQSATTEEKKEVSKQAKEVSDATSQISEALEEVVDSVEAGSANTTLTKHVVEVKQAVDEVGIDVVKVAVDGAENDEQRIAAQVLVEEKLVSILSDADGALGESEQVKGLIKNIEAPEEAGFVVDAGTRGTTTNTPKSVSQDTSTVTASGTTKTAVSGILEKSTFDQTIAAIIAEADSTSEKVKEAVVEIKALVKAGDLGAALEKAKTLRAVTSASEQTTIDIKQAVKNVEGKQSVREEKGESDRIEEAVASTTLEVVDISVSATDTQKVGEKE